jgi:hypothetical protein
MQKSVAGLDTTLRLTLREGAIYYLQDRSMTSPEPHYCIVVNCEPLNQEILLLAVCSSKVSKVRAFRKSVPDTLVEIGPTQLPGVLSEPSIVDCNSPISVTLHEFNLRFLRKEIKYFGLDVPESVCDSLCRAIQASVVVADPLKALVRRL